MAGHELDSSDLQNRGDEGNF